MSIHSIELNWIHELQSVLRGPWTDTFFIYWNYVDTTWFTLLFVAVIMQIFNRKEGISLLFIFLISSIVNLSLKKMIGFPRPCHIDPLVGILCSPSYGFPSGAAQTATIIACAAWAKCKNNTLKVFAIVFALFLCFSRIFLGLHYFTDILGGIGVGIILVILYLKLFPLLEKHWTLFSCALAILVFILGGAAFLPQATMILGIGLGLFFSRNNKPATSRLARSLTLLGVVLGSSLFLYLGDVFVNFKPLATFLAGFWFVSLPPG